MTDPAKSVKISKIWFLWKLLDPIGSQYIRQNLCLSVCLSAIPTSSNQILLTSLVFTAHQDNQNNQGDKGDQGDQGDQDYQDDQDDQDD